MSDPRPSPDSKQLDRDAAREKAPGAVHANAADEVPVPPVMSPAEVDERAQVVESLEDEDITP